MGLTSQYVFNIIIGLQGVARNSSDSENTFKNAWLTIWLVIFSCGIPHSILRNTFQNRQAGKHVLKVCLGCSTGLFEPPPLGQGQGARNLVTVLNDTKGGRQPQG